MNSLKKFAAIGGTIAVAACWPLAVGQIAQNMISDGISHLDQKELKVELVDYNRGYLNSTATTKVTVIDPALKQQLELNGFPTSMVFDHKIKHGLISVSTDTQAEDFKALPLKAHSVTQLNGSTSIDVQSEQLVVNFLHDASSKLTIAPIKASADFTSDGHIKFDYQIPSFSGDFANGEAIKVKGLTGSGDGYKEQGFWFGRQQVSVANVDALTSAGDKLFNLHKFHYVFNTDEDSKKVSFNSHHNASAESLDFESDKLTDLGIEFSFDNIDKASFTQLLSVYQKDTQPPSQQDMKVAMQHVDTLFEKGLSVALNKIQVTIREGKFNGNWTLNLPASDQKVTKNPTAVFNSVTGDTHFYISNEMVDQFPYIESGLDNFIKEGMMAKKEDGYYVDGKVINGNIEFNGGHKVPMFMLLAPFLMR
ncbi:YdgA family protein [Vibrio sp. S11_S32]|uniref:DUF945 family protein n=1 Tax=Vibrio sp. S11_S32 TaxID=2720225 RepID=UPI00168103BF|nr:DUF945 family protein [Vibrio sp. S11_S32]MBD1575711.1 YdgA family protein [Vibrio sp. S11_S32]